MSGFDSRNARMGVDGKTALPELWLTARMVFWAFLLIVLRRIVPLSRLARMMCRRDDGGDRRPERERRIAALARRLFGPLAAPASGCYPRSLLLFRFLSEAHARPRLRVGVRRSEGKIDGHAWVLVDGLPIGEPLETIADYAIVFELDSARS